MIYIGYNYEGYPVSIISAKTKESANAYWQGKGITPHSTKELDLSEDRENEDMGYVTPLLVTEEVDSYEIRDLSSRKLLMVSK